MKVIRRTILMRGTNKEVRAYGEDFGNILTLARERLAKNRIAGIEIGQDFDGTVVCSLVIKEFESDEEKMKFMENLSKAKKQ